MKKRTRMLAAAVMAALVLLSAGSVASAAKKVSYTTGASEPELFTMSPDGANQKRVGNGFPVAYPSGMSRDGSKVAFSRYMNGSTDVFLAAANGKNPVRLTKTPKFSEWSPSFSPDGQRVVYVAHDWFSPAPMGKVVVERADGTKPKTIMEGPILSEYLVGSSWSPDGEWIAFGQSASDPANDGIVVMRPNGANKQLLIPMEGYPQGVSWSPDGARIMFSIEYELYVADADGSNVTLVTTGAGGGTWPVWVTSNRIVYTDYDGSDSEIWHTTPSGDARVQITDNGVSDQTGYFT